MITTYFIMLAEAGVEDIKMMDMVENEDERLDLEIEIIDKEIAEAHKVGKKVLICVVALPIIGVAVLAALGALSYEYNVLSPKIRIGKNLSHIYFSFKNSPAKFDKYENTLGRKKPLQNSKSRMHNASFCLITINL